MNSILDIEERHSFQRLVAILTVLALIVRLPGLFWGFDLFRPDTFTYLSVDECLMTRQIWHWIFKGVFERNDYYMGWPVLVRLTTNAAMLFGAPSKEMTILMCGRVIGILFGALTVPAVIQLAKILGGSKSVSWWAGVFIAFSPLHVAYSHHSIPGVTMAFFTVVAMVGFIRFYRSDKDSDFYLGCVAAGYAMAVKYSFVLLIPIFFLLFRRGRARLRLWAGPLLLILVFFVMNGFHSPWGLSGFGNQLLPDNFTERRHHLWTNPPMYVITLIPSLGLPGFCLAIFGLLWVRRHFPAAEGRDIFFILGLPLFVQFVSISLLTANFPRHLLIFSPFAAVLSGFGCVEAIRILREKGKKVASFAVAVTFWYQVAGAASIEWLHMRNRYFLAQQLISSQMSFGDFVCVPSALLLDVMGTREIPHSQVTLYPDGARFVLLSSEMRYRFLRSYLTPLTDSPKVEEMFHSWLISDNAKIKDIIDERSTFFESRRFEATGFVPEYLLYKKFFSSLIFETGDVSVYERL